MLANRFQKLIAQGEFDQLYELLETKKVAMAFPEYNRTYLKLNAKIMEGDEKGARQILSDLLSRHLPKNMHEDIVLKAFGFYIDHQDGKRAKKMLAEIEQWDDKHAAAKTECRRTYDIVIKKSTAYIDGMERELTEASGMQRGQLLYLLSLQYVNAGDQERAKRYRDQMVTTMTNVMANDPRFRNVVPDLDGNGTATKK